MKRLRKILCIVLTGIMVLSLFASCSKGKIVAVYDDTPVFESDVQDFTNYQLITSFRPDMTDQDVAGIIENSVKTYVKYLILEIDLEEKGYTIDEDKLDELFVQTKKEIDKEIGYKKWCKSYRVSKNFLREELRRYELTNLYKNYAMKTIRVSDEEIEEYYRIHSLTEFARPAGYYWTAILREVLDINNEKECAEAKAEAQQYIDKINAGTLTLDDVKKELFETYTKEDGYTNGPIFSGPDFTSVDNMTVIKDEAALEAILADIDERYKDRDPGADKSSDGYKKYMSYLGEVFKANVFYALQHMEKGQVYSEPIKSFSGYFIIRLDGIETTNEFVPLEEVKNEIGYKLQLLKSEEQFAEYMESLEEKYEVEYVFNPAFHG